MGVRLENYLKILRKDRTVQIIIVAVLAGILLVTLSEYYILPYVSTVSTSTTLSNNSNPGQGVYPQENLSIYALAPQHPIYISIDDSQHHTLNYEIYLINDTNRAIGLGPKTLLSSGQFNDSTSLVINNTIYHMSYELSLSSASGGTYSVPVSVKQTVYTYPPENYYLLIPGIILLVAGVVLTGSKIMSISSDREGWMDSLGLDRYDKNKGMKSVYSSQKKKGTNLGILNIAIGSALIIVGFFLFGHQYYLSWIAIAAILAGIAYIIGGLIRAFSRRS